METKKVHVSFFRQRNVEGSVIPMYIYIDGNLVAQLKNGGSTICDIESGVHEICVKMWGSKRKSKIDFLSEDENVCINVGLKYGFITKKADILSIERESDVQKLRDAYQGDDGSPIVCNKKIDESIFDNIELSYNGQTAMFSSS